MLERVRYRTSRRNWIAAGDAPGKTCVKKSSSSVSSWEDIGVSRGADSFAAQIHRHNYRANAPAAAESS